MMTVVPWQDRQPCLPAIAERAAWLTTGKAACPTMHNAENRLRQRDLRSYN
jgi:hypothetical protein